MKLVSIMLRSEIWKENLFVKPMTAMCIRKYSMANESNILLKEKRRKKKVMKAMANILKYSNNVA